MKIGILTYHWVPNFGANLQALATVSLLKKLGHEPIVINYRPKELIKKFEQSVSKEQIDIHQKFIDEFIPQTELCSTLKEVASINEKYKFDVLVSGSDAVFRLDYEKGREDVTFPNPYWLTFALKSQKKIFLSASSMGTDFLSLETNIRNGIIDALKNSSINVRDSWTKKGLQKLDSNLKINETIDPVFILNKNYTIPERFIFKESKKYILLNLYKSLAKPEWIKQFVRVANKNNFDVYILPNPEDNSFGKEIANRVLNLPIHPLTWYSMIQNASGYLGVRFHPIVTSISNRVPFLAFDTYQTKLFKRKSSKTFDICNKVNGKKYVINRYRKKLLGPERAYKLLMENHIDYDFIHDENIKIIKLFQDL